MIVRCGRCQVELEVSGPGEFACPSCGTRNAVRGGSASGAPFEAGGLTIPGGRPAGVQPPPAQSQDDPSVKWESCPNCSWRFAMGEVERITCPSCRTEFAVTPQGLAPAE